MGEFDEKLSAILGDEAAMGQIMALARSLSQPESAGEEEAQERGPANPVCGGQDVRLLAALSPYLKDSRRKKLDRALELLQLLRLLKGEQS